MSAYVSCANDYMEVRRSDIFFFSPLYICIFSFVWCSAHHIRIVAVSDEINKTDRHSLLFYLSVNTLHRQALFVGTKKKRQHKTSVIGKYSHLDFRKLVFTESLSK
jgi:hypothetical protein